jgi:hypothetical protein
MVANLSGFFCLTSSNETRFKGKRIVGCTGSSSYKAINARAGIGDLYIVIPMVDNNTCWGTGSPTGAPSYDGDGKAVFVGVTLQNNVAGDVEASTASIARGHYVNCIFSSTTLDNLVASGVAPSFLTFHAFNQNATDHRYRTKYFDVLSETSVRHTSSGLAWKLNVLSTTGCTAKRPAWYRLAQFAFAASAEVTITCWMRRTNTGLTAGIAIRGMIIPGVPSDVNVPMTANADTWEQVTLTFTPTIAGVVEVFAYAYGGTTYSAYFDDVNASQA